jgi:hypothetical protein
MGDNKELIEKFRAVAMNFIEVVDAAPKLETGAFLANVGRSMAELYSVALSLPAVEPDTTGTDEPSFETNNWDSLRRSLQEKNRLARYLLDGLRFHGQRRTSTRESLGRHFGNLFRHQEQS